MFFYFFLDSNKKTLYLCNVFFIVLDLRLTKVRVAAATHFFALTFSAPKKHFLHTLFGFLLLEAAGLMGWVKRHQHNTFYTYSAQ